MKHIRHNQTRYLIRVNSVEFCDSKSFSIASEVNIGELMRDLKSFLNRFKNKEDNKKNFCVTIMDKNKNSDKIKKSKSFRISLFFATSEEILNEINIYFKNSVKYADYKIIDSTHLLGVRNILSTTCDTRYACVEVDDILLAIEEIKKYVSEEMSKKLETDIVFSGIKKNSSSHRILIQDMPGKKPLKSKCFTITFPNYSSEEILTELINGINKRDEL